MLIISMGNIIGWSLAYDNVPERLVSGILSITTNGNIVMLLIILLLFVIGCVMEAFAAELILIPVLAPLGEAMGYDYRSCDSAGWNASLYYIKGGGYRTWKA